MATHDHTARARPSGRTRPASPLHHDVPFYPLSKTQAMQQTYVTTLAGIGTAAHTMHELLDAHETLQRAGLKRGCSQCGKGSLTSTQVNGLFAALFYLRQYVDSLHPEQSDSSESGG